MMAADSSRIDALVGDVGHIKGRVESVDKGINELKSAMAVLVRHEVLMEQAGAIAAANAKKIEGVDKRLQDVEKHMPGLIEGRADVRRIFWLVVSAVVLGGLALIVKLP
jgi:hypothetical protein